MTACHDPRRIIIDSVRVDDLLDLRNQILRAVLRRDAEPANSATRLAIEAEIDALVERVWLIQDHGRQRPEGVPEEA